MKLGQQAEGLRLVGYVVVHKEFIVLDFQITLK